MKIQALLMSTILVGSLGGFHSAQAQTGGKPEKLTTRQRSHVDGLLREFKKAKNPSTREELFNRVLEPGPAAAGYFLKSIDKDVEKALKDYQKKLAYHMEVDFRNRIKGKKNLKEIQTLRDTINALRDQSNLSKGDLYSKGDPAVKRLRELMLPDPVSVVEKGETLKGTRMWLMEIRYYQNVCYQALEEEGFDLARRLARIESRAAALPLFKANNQVDTFEKNEKLSSKIDVSEAEGILDLNILRLLLGLKALLTDVKLCDAARDHSKDMRTHDFFSHKSPVPGKTSFTDRAGNFGTSAKAENLYQGRESPLDANQSWFHSPGHHKNMLNPGHQFVGLGRSEEHWTEMFR